MKPTKGVLVGNNKMETWLEMEVNEWLSINIPYGDCVAAGLLARLWRPCRGMAGEELRRIYEQETPRGRAVAWFKSANPDQETVRKIVDHAVTLQILLRDECIEISHAAELDRSKASRYAIRWLLERDHLESLHFLLSNIGMKEQLEDALKLLDSENSKSMSETCMRLGKLDNVHLLAVFCFEPDNWWGRCIFGHELPPES